MTSPIDISPVHKKIVYDILRKHLSPSTKVWVFGSRADWTTKNSSDLDLALEGESKIDYKITSALEDAFEESDLPYTVDVVDINTVGSKFKRIIKKQRVPLFKNGQIEARKESLAKSNNSINREVILSDVAELIMGHSPPGSTYNESGDGMVFFQGVKDFNYRHPSPRVFCSAPSRIAQQGDILFSVRAPIGRVNIADRECAVGRGLAIIRCSNTTDARYLEFLLQHMQPLWSMMDKNGTIFGNATKSDLEKLVIRWPNAQVRKTIAHVLGMLDDKIELNQRMSKTLEGISRALFKSWFVNFEPVRAKMDGRWKHGKSLPGLPAHLYDLFPDNLKDSKFGEIPEGWTIKDLTYYSILNPESWSRTKAPEVVEYVDLSNTKLGTIHSTQYYIWRDAPSRAQRVLRLGDTIIGTVRPGNNSYALVGRSGLTGSTGFAVLRPKHNRYREFVYLASTNLQNIKRLAHHADGAAYPAVSSEIIMNTSVASSNDNVLDQFSCMISPLINKILKIDAEAHVLSNLRDVLLPKLMSREIQLPSLTHRSKK